jgi:hypothetical protein
VEIFTSTHNELLLSSWPSSNKLSARSPRYILSKQNLSLFHNGAAKGSKVGRIKYSLSVLSSHSFMKPDGSGFVDGGGSITKDIKSKDWNILYFNIAHCSGCTSPARTNNAKDSRSAMCYNHLLLHLTCFMYSLFSASHDSIVSSMELQYSPISLWSFFYSLTSPHHPQKSRSTSTDAPHSCKNFHPHSFYWTREELYAESWTVRHTLMWSPGWWDWDDCDTEAQPETRKLSSSCSGPSYPVTMYRLW